MLTDWYNIVGCSSFLIWLWFFRHSISSKVPSNNLLYPTWTSCWRLAVIILLIAFLLFKCKKDVNLFVVVIVKTVNWNSWTVDSNSNERNRFSIWFCLFFQKWDHFESWFRTQSTVHMFFFVKILIN